MKSSKLLERTVNKLVKASFKDGKIIEAKVIKSIKLLKTLSKTDTILALSEYLRGIKRVERKHTLYVETVIPLNSVQLKKIKKIVEKKVKVTKVITQINTSILGGFILKVGDQVWDQSILDKINQVKEAIAHGKSNQSD